jgi:hypothetical protein
MDVAEYAGLTPGRAEGTFPSNLEGKRSGVRRQEGGEEERDIS